MRTLLADQEEKDAAKGTPAGLIGQQHAAPEFSISYISAIERGKIRPSLTALSILARRLDVPLTFLLEGSPVGAAEARAVGYSPADSSPDQRIDVDLLQASVLVQQDRYKETEQLPTPIQPERITTDQVYRRQIYLAARDYQEAVADLLHDYSIEHTEECIVTNGIIITEEQLWLSSFAKHHVHFS